MHRNGWPSYLSHRKQRLLIKSCIPDPFNLGSGVLQGSCLGPLLFSIYVAGLFRIIDRHLPNAHSYRRRWYSNLSVFSATLTGVTGCCAEEYREMCCWCPCLDSLWPSFDKWRQDRVCNHRIPSASVQGLQLENLRSNPTRWYAILEHGLILIWQWILTLGKCVVKHSAAFTTSGRLGNFFRKKQRRVWCILSSPCISITVTHCSMVFQQYQYDRLQRVLNAAARVVCLVPKFDHITPFLRRLHWLPVRYRVMFKILLLLYKALHVKAPSYISGI